VLVNGKEAKATAANFTEWEITLDAATTELKALAEDAAGNVEKTPHEVKLKWEVCLSTDFAKSFIHRFRR
jgi:hypothetical protein